MSDEEEEEEEEKDVCPDADSNPRCPYVVQMKQSTTDIAIIKTALVGDDFQGGLIKRVGDIESNLKKRWTAKDWGSFFVGLGALITALAAYLNSLK